MNIQTVDNIFLTELVNQGKKHPRIHFVYHTNKDCKMMATADKGGGVLNNNSDR